MTENDARPPRLDPIVIFQHYYGIDRRQARRLRRRLAKSCVIPPASTGAAQ